MAVIVITSEFLAIFIVELQEVIFRSHGCRDVHLLLTTAHL